MQDSGAPLRAEEGKMLIAGRRIARVLASILIVGSLTAGCATSTQPAPDMDGLVLQPSQGLDAVYLRPGTNFKAYGNIVLQPVQVEFDKNWDPNSSQPDVTRRLSEQDIQKIKDEMASEFPQHLRQGARVERLPGHRERRHGFAGHDGDTDRRLHQRARQAGAGTIADLHEGIGAHDSAHGTA
jgi:hypothetical protein